ncbi:MAG: aminopeptidase P family protein [Prevotella sp.]|nr:aminopeptidase P family protein [Candidatus Prevotella equi]
MNYKTSSLRELMQRESIDAIIFPTSDPHNSEYTASHWQSRKYVTGFTGSAGTAVVTLHDAALWTDSRYFLQAAEQLKDGPFQLMKEGVEGTPDIVSWIKRRMSVEGGRCVAVDGMVMPYADVVALQKDMQRIGVTIRTNYDAMQMLWTNRPVKPSGEIYAIDNDMIGETVTEKLQRIRHAMHEERCEGHVLTDLMSIAWTLNLRGSDVPMTPVFIAFMYVATDSATLFCNGPLTAEAQRRMSEAGVTVKHYDDFASFLKTQKDKRIMCDGKTTCYTLYNIIKEWVVDMPSPVMSMKAVKNAKEIEGFRRCMLRDGVAMVRFLRWLKPAVEAGGQTEISVSDKLESLRREAKEYKDLSFSTISGYQEHGAIVHYTATKDSDKALKAEGLLLVDSGAQYTDGTTDITRTIALGPVSDEMRRAYTLVLKANIALATVRFPEGTNGTQLDAIARSVLWSGGLNYLHGTGHGVGWCLSVHEGPHAIRMDWRPEPLKVGMTVTDEPGVYLAGRFGIRTENMMLVTKVQETEFGVFCQLQPLTLCPIDTTPILWDMMTEEEITWLNDYHKTVREALLPLLTDEDDKQWLIEVTN